MKSKKKIYISHLFGALMLLALVSFLIPRNSPNERATGNASQTSETKPFAPMLSESENSSSRAPTSQPTPTDIRSIEEQIHDALYQFKDHGNVIATANNANRFTASFDRQLGSFTVASFETESWQWRLKTLGEGSIHAAIEGNSLSLEHSENLTEWFVNDPRGIEQGFTVTEPLADGRINMSLTTNLVPHLTGSGDAQEIRFDNPDTGETQLRYAELFVTDANGDRVPAEIELAQSNSSCISNPHEFGLKPDLLSLVLDDSCALYPLTVDPIITSLAADLVDAELRGGDSFGDAAAISGDVMVVGTSGVGKATVFELGSNGVWSETATLKPSPHNTLFGLTGTVAIHNDRIVVGAPDDIDQAIPSAYVFERNQTGSGEPWVQTAHLLPDPKDNAPSFGHFVAISEDTIAVTDPNPLNESVYIYEFDGQDWQLEAKFTDLSPSRGLAVLTDRIIVDTIGNTEQVIERDPAEPQGWRLGATLESDPDEDLRFDGVLDADGDYVVVAASVHESFQIGHLPLAVFHHTGNETWQKTVVPFPARSIREISISGHRIAVGHRNFNDESAVTILEKDTPVVGAWGTVATFSWGDAQFKESGCIDLSGDRLLMTKRTDFSALGRAVIYELRNGRWAPVATPQPDTAQTDEDFGRVLAMDRDILVVGSPQRRNIARGGAQVGTAYAFHRDSSSTAHSWVLVQELPLPDDVITGDQFGASVDTADGEWIVIGAPGRDVGGDSDSGSAYLYRRNDDDTWELIDQLLPSTGTADQRFGEAVAMSSGSLHLLVGAPGNNGGRGHTFAYQRDLANPLDWRETQIIRAAKDAEGTGAALSIHGASAIVGAPKTRQGDGAIHVLRFTDQWRTVAFVRGQHEFGAALAMGGGGFGLVAEPIADRVFAVDLRDGALTPLTLPTGESLPPRLGTTLASNGEFAYVGAPEVGKIYIFSRGIGVNSRWRLHDVLDGARGIYRGGIAASGRNLALGMPTEGPGGRVEVQRMTVRQWSATRGGGGAPAIPSVFGSLAVDDDTLVIGQPDIALPIAGGGLSSGSVVVFRRGLEANRWGLERLLLADRSSDENFGTVVDVSGERIIVSAPGGNAVYFFRRRSQGLPRWELDKRITVANDVRVIGEVALSGRHAVVTLEGDDLLQTFRETEGVGWRSETRLGNPGSSFVRRPAGVAIDGDRIAYIQNDNPSDHCVVVEFTGDDTWVEAASFPIGRADAVTVALHGETIAYRHPR